MLLIQEGADGLPGLYVTAFVPIATVLVDPLLIPFAGTGNGAVPRILDRAIIG